MDRLGKAVLLFLAVAVLTTACSKKTPSDPGDSPVVKNKAYWVETGWEFYADSLWQDARNAFTNALNKDSTYMPALAAIGWAELELGWTGLSLSEFEKAIATDSSVVHCYYGAAYTSHTFGIIWPANASTYYNKTILFALSGLELGGDSYIFEHNSLVRSGNLRVLLAGAYFSLAEYEKAESVVEFLNPSLDLDRYDPGYIQDLLMAIESLGGQFQ